MKKLFFVLLVLCCMVSSKVFADEFAVTRPIQIALVNPIQLFDEDTTIVGLRLNLIYGVNEDVTGLDFGLVNRAKGNVIGWEGAFFVNYVEGEFFGLQGAGIANMNMGPITKALQGAWVFNYVENDFIGLQNSFIANITKGDFTGLQFAFGYNYAGTMNGLQIGLVNVAENLNGLQIGLLNFNANEDPFGFLPIVNWSF